MMAHNAGEKKYGLIIPSKNKGARSAFLSGSSEPKPKVFSAADSSSDENLEEEDDTKQALDWRTRTAAKATEKSMQRNQARQAAMKALEEDPTVFQYDEVYDEMQQKKEEKKPVKEEKKPKYIANLLRTAEMRKVELERRTERKVQKERETEGDMFSDKEAFVTPAYRAKLAELKQLEEEERLRDLREGHLDVTKQADMSGFYRHLYKQTFADETKKVDDAPATEPVTFKPRDEGEAKTRRQYRSRKEEEEEEVVVAEESEVNQDQEPEPQAAQEEPPQQGFKKPDKRPVASAALLSAAANDRAAAADRAIPQDKQAEPVDESDSSSSSSEEEEDEEVKIVPPKVKIDIWKKRTEGHLLEEAIQRYQLRKEAREQGLVMWP
nr:EOG090X0D2W [Eurycercus lamellatus]